MKQKSTITIIGAASTTFGPKVLRDILNHPQVAGAIIRNKLHYIVLSPAA